MYILTPSEKSREFAKRGVKFSVECMNHGYHSYSTLKAARLSKKRWGGMIVKTSGICDEKGSWSWEIISK